MKRTRNFLRLAGALALAGCGADTPGPLEVEPTVEPTPPVDIPAVADPYPIRLHWASCTRPNNYDDCVPVNNARVRFGSMIVDAAEDAAAEWGRLLHSTPRTSWVAPLDGWDRNWPNRNTPPHLWGIVPGDTIPPGLDVLAVRVVDQEVCGRSCATGSPVRPPGGFVDRVRMIHLVVDSQYDNPGDQRWVSLHELGHAIAMTNIGLHEWSDHIVKMPLEPDQREVLDSDSIWVQTHPEIVEIYERYGGGQWDWMGKQRGVAMDPHGSNHWNDCAAPQDVMGPWYFYPDVSRSERVRTWISPLTAKAAQLHGGFAVDLDQIQSTDYHVPHYWLNVNECRILAN